MRRYYVAGHRGMVGSAIVRQLQARQQAGEALELLTRTHAELDLREQVAVEAFFAEAKPEVGVLAAAGEEAGVLAALDRLADKSLACVHGALLLVACGVGGGFRPFRDFLRQNGAAEDRRLSAGLTTAPAGLPIR
jgi:TPP-dependent indolepyruvate ferredoxin oxidoreductase alpha subunit